MSNTAASYVYAKNIACVIVCYHPNTLDLADLCHQVHSEGALTILVDNTEVSDIEKHFDPLRYTLIKLGHNSGIALAQNIGVAKALEGGAEIVVFFDQDSKIAPGFLTQLVAPLQAGVAGVTAALYVDADNGSALPSTRISRHGFRSQIHVGDTSEPYPVDIAISSGTAATKEVFAQAGLLNESFFIDLVDTEWCLRCRSRGIPISVVPSAVMRQRIGTRSVRVGPLTVLVHNPNRCYYQIRNSLRMFCMPHVPLLFSLTTASAIVLSRLLLLFVVAKKISFVQAYYAGVKDGLRGIGGPKPG